ncbi:hypothetical protein GJ496_003919 [Pomphorhynchus laevis]|nr:hypothetical protein GJ496_003919 [Pomphorhynchus laevis]
MLVCALPLELLGARRHADEARATSNDNLLLRFIYSLGRLYGFVASDMLSKVKDISAKLKSDRINYATVQKMIQYECGDKNDQHGTRQFLWLHRANEFVVEFLQALRANVLFHNKHQFTKEEIDWKQCEYILDQWKDKETHDIVWNVYMATLSKHHSWITHQIVHVASYATPSSKEMLKIFGGDSKTNLLQLNKLTVEIIDKARQDFVNLDAYLEKMNVRLLY